MSLQATTIGEADDKCETFIIHGEDHTLANSLNYMIHKKYVYLSFIRTWERKLL